MFKELLKQLPWGALALVVLVQLAILAAVIAGATWIVKAIW